MSTCFRTDNTYRFIYVSKDNLLKVIEFLGEDFIAITSGCPISVDGFEVKFDQNSSGETIKPNLEEAMVVFYPYHHRYIDATKPRIQVASMGSVIVEDSISGYMVMDSEVFKKYYTINAESEFKDMVTDAFTQPSIFI